MSVVWWIGASIPEGLSTSVFEVAEFYLEMKRVGSLEIVLLVYQSTRRCMSERLYPERRSRVPFCGFVPKLPANLNRKRNKTCSVRVT